MTFAVQFERIPIFHHHSISYFFDHMFRGTREAVDLNLSIRLLILVNDSAIVEYRCRSQSRSSSVIQMYEFNACEHQLSFYLSDF